MKKISLVLSLNILFAWSVKCFNVLIIFPLNAQSHNLMGSTLAKELAYGGFNVTYVSPLAVDQPPDNIRFIKLNNMIDWAKGMTSDKRHLIYSVETWHPISNLRLLNSLGEESAETFFNDIEVQNLLKSNEHYDVVILEQFWNEAMKIFGYHFKAPLILFLPVEANRWVNGFVGNPEPISYISDFLFVFNGATATFIERVHNFIFSIICQLNLDWSFYPAQNKLLKKYYPNAPDLSDLQKNVSFIFMNSHESISQPIPLVPNMVNIGGYHLRPPKPLPENLRMIMDNAKQGVIYFSLGTLLPISKMPPHIKEAIVKVLRARKEIVLWKSDEDIMINKPDNIEISNWFPQQDILGHPNCKLFITHGGQASRTETVYHGVPVLVTPIFGDQKPNAERIEAIGIGKYMSLSSITENSFKQILNETLENPVFRRNVEHRSKILRDRLVSPKETIRYWVDYVIRYNGARHLRVIGADLPFYKYYMLDVVAVICVIVYIKVYLLIKLAKVCVVKNVIQKEKQN